MEAVEGGKACTKLYSMGDRKLSCKPCEFIHKGRGIPSLYASQQLKCDLISRGVGHRRCETVYPSVYVYDV